MNAAVILIVGIAILACGYIFYGGWLSKQWGIDPSRPTPAHELDDGMDVYWFSHLVNTGMLEVNARLTDDFLQPFHENLFSKSM